METAIINKVVVHFLSGTVMKGTTGDFFPNKTQFHLTDVEGKTEGGAMFHRLYSHADLYAHDDVHTCTAAGLLG